MKNFRVNITLKYIKWVYYLVFNKTLFVRYVVYKHFFIFLFFLHDDKYCVNNNL